jgi:hypothetical protein
MTLLAASAVQGGISILGFLIGIYVGKKIF